MCIPKFLTSWCYLETFVFNQFLETVKNEELLGFAVKLAYVAGTHPAVGSEGLCISFRVVEVTFHDAGTSDKQFTLLIISQL